MPESPIETRMFSALSPEVTVQNAQSFRYLKGAGRNDRVREKRHCHRRNGPCRSRNLRRRVTSREAHATTNHQRIYIPRTSCRPEPATTSPADNAAPDDIFLVFFFSCGAHGAAAVQRQAKPREERTRQFFHFRHPHHTRPCAGDNGNTQSTHVKRDALLFCFF